MLLAYAFAFTEEPQREDCQRGGVIPSYISMTKVIADRTQQLGGLVKLAFATP
jgi:hypothetical protein